MPPQALSRVTSAQVSVPVSVPLLLSHTVLALLVALILHAPAAARADVVLRQAWTFKYCKFHANTSSDGTPTNYFTSESFTYYGQNPVFTLPSTMDAVQPSTGEYSMNGNCGYLLDPNCGVIAPGLDCTGCCYLTPSPQTFKVSCFDDFSKDCTYKYSTYSGLCGTPPSQFVSIMYCNSCIFSS